MLWLPQSYQKALSALYKVVVETEKTVVTQWETNVKQLISSSKKTEMINVLQEFTNLSHIDF